MEPIVLAPMRAMSDDELLALYLADEESARAALAEAARRDRLEQAARDRRRVQQEWMDLQHAQYLAADAATRGNLLSREGRKAGVSEFALWTGPEALARRYASWELNEFWDANPRVTVTEYRRQLAAAARDARQQALFGDQADDFTADDFTAEITEVITDGHDAEDLAGCAAVMAGHAAAPVRHLGAGPAAHAVRSAGRSRDPGPVRHDGRVMISFDQVAPQDTMLLSQRPYLPYGEVSLVYGEGSLGKGRMVQSIIAAVANGEPVGLDETAADDAADVILILPEDKQGESAVKRLIAAGADLSRCGDMTRTAAGERFKLSATPRHPGHLPELRAAVAELRADGRNPRLLVIDPLGACIGEGTILTSKGARHLVESLQDLAEQTGLCVLVVAHPVSGGKLQGSWALQQALRSVFYVRRDESNPDIRLLGNVKGNDVPPELAADIPFTITDGPRGPRAEWIRPPKRGPQVQAEAGWRDELAARRAGKAAPALTYRAIMTVKGRGTRILASGIADEKMARMICEATPHAKALGVPLLWAERRPGVWMAGNQAVAWAVAAESASRAAV